MVENPADHSPEAAFRVAQDAVTLRAYVAGVAVGQIEKTNQAIQDIEQGRI